MCESHVVRMVFGPDDDDAFFAAKAELTKEFAAWTRARGGFGDHADLLLDFKWGYADGDLLTWRVAHVDELFGDWMPRKVSLPDDMVPEVVADAAEFFRFLADTHRLGKRSDPLARLLGTVEELGAGLTSRMADPGHWGMAKSLTSAMHAEGTDPTDPEQMETFFEAFNARPFHERDATLGPTPFAEPEPIVLPPRPRPDPEAVRADAAGAPLLAALLNLAEYTADGRALTKKGNLRLADARVLVELLETGDEMDPVVGNSTWKTRSAEDLPGLDTLVTLAREARVVRVVKGTMHGVAKFRQLAARDPVAALDRVVDLIWLIGPLIVQRPWSVPVYAGLEFFLDAATASVVAAVYENAEPLDFETVVARTITQADRQLELPDFITPDHLADVVRSDLGDALALLGRAGILVHTGREERENQYGYARPFGGTIALTAYGIACCQRLLPEWGFEAPVLEAFTATDTDDAAVVFEALRAQLDAGGPAALMSAFDSLGPTATALVETGWRTDDAAVLPVLEALGRHHLHKPTARAARKAVFQHRSWCANLN